MSIGCTREVAKEFKREGWYAGRQITKALSFGSSACGQKRDARGAHGDSKLAIQSQNGQRSSIVEGEESRSVIEFALVLS
jgi:hypothetical protein